MDRAPSAPSVQPLPPSRDLHYDHHGPATGQLGLSTDRPTSFHNPWPSYRFATLSDAWLAYQRGAAIAPAQRESTCDACGEWSRVASRSASRTGFRDQQEKEASGAGMPFYDPDDDDDPAEEWGDDDDDLTYLARKVTHDTEPPAGYIRPEMRAMQADDEADDWREPPVCVRPPRWLTGEGRESDRGEEGPPRPAVTWLGHASTLVQIPFGDGSGLAGVLFDPIFSQRCSPTQMLGPARSLDPPCSVAELPPIHLVIISHDHYDHLDYTSIMDLWNYHNETVHFVVPLCVGPWFTSCGIPEARVTELDWWCEALVQFPSASPSASGTSTPVSTYPPTREPELDPSSRLTLKVACCPAQHRSGRGVFDQMSTLWASWAVGVVPPDAKNPLAPGMSGWNTFKLYFGGDTGYRYATAPDSDDTAICPAFEQIGDAYGPFSLALLPLSTGSSLPFLRKTLNISLDQYTLTSSQHCSPADSLRIHGAVRARRTVGMHWGTFCDSAEARATRVDFGRARRDAAVGSDWENPGMKGVFIAVDIGETVHVEP
jgi:L-ascorbate metabolism protein UlaG (beta-lactamase superfamily)